VRFPRRIQFCFIIATAILTTGSVSADERRAEEFALAATQTGCLSIPYSSYQASCKSHQRQVQKFCKESGKFSCSDLSIKSRQVNVDNIKKGVAAMRKAKAPKEDIKKKQAQLKDAKDELKRVRQQVRKNLQTAKGCYTNRVAVHNIFGKILSRIKLEKDEDVQSSVATLVSHYQSERLGHTKQIFSAQQALAICVVMRDGK
jgi:hypothetical protein